MCLIKSEFVDEILEQCGHSNENCGAVLSFIAIIFVVLALAWDHIYNFIMMLKQSNSLSHVFHEFTTFRINMH